MQPAEIKATLRELGGGANKRLGQNFLIDREVLSTIVELAPAHPASLVLEVGPGLGVLTRELLLKGCRVLAIERDGRFVEYLNQNPLLAKEGAGGGGTRGEGDLRVVRGDAAELDWLELIGDEEWSLVSNLPYSITSLALRKALWSTRPAEHVVVLVQKEVAQRVVSLAPEGKTSLLSLMVALVSESSRIVRKVPPGAFFPPPKVDSAVLQIISMPWPERVAKWGIEPEAIMRVAKIGFAHPRKKLQGNLITGNLLTREVAEKIFEELEFSPNVRAEDLSPTQWAKLAIAVT